MMLSRPTAFDLRTALRLVGLLAVFTGAAPAVAQVAVNQILFPANIGRTLDATVSIDFTRTSAAPAVIRTPIPAQLGVNPPAPPAGCTVTAGPVMECAVPAGAAGSSGSLSFPVRGSVLGSFSLVATATGGSIASNTGTVRSSGDLTVLKTKSPAGNLINGQSTTFTLQPQLAGGADDLPAGATLTLTDQLPGTVTDFAVAGISASAGLSCNGVAAANASRTVSCSATGPLTAAAVNALQLVITGAPGTTGSFTNVASVGAGAPAYYDRNPDNNTANVSYTVDAGGDVQAQGSFPAAPVAIGSAQTLNLGWRNNGPVAMGPGGTVSTVLPAGFTVTPLPCSPDSVFTPTLCGPGVAEMRTAGESPTSRPSMRTCPQGVDHTLIHPFTTAGAAELAALALDVAAARAQRGDAAFVVAAGEPQRVLLQRGVVNLGLRDVRHAAFSSFAFTPAITWCALIGKPA